MLSTGLLSLIDILYVQYTICTLYTIRMHYITVYNIGKLKLVLCPTERYLSSLYLVGPHGDSCMGKTKRLFGTLVTRCDYDMVPWYRLQGI